MPVGAGGCGPGRASRGMRSDRTGAQGGETGVSKAGASKAVVEDHQPIACGEERLDGQHLPDTQGTSRGTGISKVKKISSQPMLSSKR